MSPAGKRDFLFLAALRREIDEKMLDEKKVLVYYESLIYRRER
jgi:hypothetical protein